MSQFLEEYRRLAGLGLGEARKPAAAKANPDLKAILAQLDRDYGDLEVGIRRVSSLGGDWTDQDRSAIARLRGDLDAVDALIKGWKSNVREPGAAKSAKPTRGDTPADVVKKLVKGSYDKGFAESFPRSMTTRGASTGDIDEWARSMQAALIMDWERFPDEFDPGDKFDNYNEFRIDRVAKWLKTWQDEAKKEWDSTINVQPGREYSIALYITGPHDLLIQMEAEKGKVRADEADIQSDGSLRLWWD